MVIAKLTYRDSLRDIVTALESRPMLLYQMGFRSRVARSTYDHFQFNTSTTILF